MTETQKKLGTVYCSYGHEGESNWILPLGFDLVKNIEKADVVVFGGGKDIDPGFYGEKRGSSTDAPSERDRVEKADFLKVQELRKQGKKIKTVGVCRGAQLLCALSGGSLIQDVGNHCGMHSITTFEKTQYTTNSIHHQMMYPYTMDKKNYKILAWSTKNLSSKYLNGWNKEKWLVEGFKELEIVLFKNTDSLGYQMHPEMMKNNPNYKETLAYFQDLFIRFFNNEL